MGKDQKEESGILRTGDVPLEHSEVEIYLNKITLDATTEEYIKLKNAYINLQVQQQANIGGIVDNSGGDGSEALVSKEVQFSDSKMQLIFDSIKKTIDILSDASVKAKFLLLRCENFYEIIIGEAGFLGYAAPTVGEYGNLTGGAQAPICPELFLDKAYYGEDGGTFTSNTEDAVDRLMNLTEEKNTLKEILSHLEVFKIDIKKECADIDDDCKKKERLERLLDSFTIYVQDVNKFNNTIGEAFNNIYDSSCVFDYSRTYDYPEYEGRKSSVLLDRVVRDELHEMGLTDEEIENALTKSSYTLTELASATEAIIAEDKLFQNGGAEIMLFKSVLSGKAKEGYNTYLDRLDHSLKINGVVVIPEEDAETNLGYGIAKYIAGTVLLGKDSQNQEVLYGNKEELANQINAALGCKSPRTAIKLLNLGSYKLAMESDNIASITSEDCRSHSYIYSEYKTNMLINDTFTFLSCKLDADKPDWIARDRWDHYSITDITYSTGQGGLGISIESTKWEKTEAEFSDGYKEWTPTDETKNFTMFISYECGPSSVAMGLTESELAEKCTEANAEQKELVGKLYKDGIVFTGTVCGGMLGSPTAGATVGSFIADYAEASYDGQAGEDVYKKYVDKAMKKGIDYKFPSEAKDGKEYYSQASQTVVDLYQYGTYTGVEDANNNRADYYKVKLTGSVGICKIDYDLDDGKEPTTEFCTTHSGFVAPEYLSTFEGLATEGEGLAAKGGWDPEFKATMEKELYNPQNKVQDPETLKKLINGGYDITNVKDGDYEALNGNLNKLQDVYNHVSTLPDMNGHIPGQVATQAGGQEPSNDVENNEILQLWGK